VIALDTNVVVRLIARDHPDQVKRAAALVRAEPCWISLTVLLETEWVLRAVYDYRPAQTLEAFERLASMEHVTLQAPTVVRQAIEWHRAGLDFADAIHLAGSREKRRFASFDESLRKRSSRLRTAPAVFAP